VGRVDNPRPPEIDPVLLGDFPDRRGGADEDRNDQPDRARLDRAFQRRPLARMRHGGRHRL
jgi:hypothetical protein